MKDNFSHVDNLNLSSVGLENNHVVRSPDSLCNSRQVNIGVVKSISCRKVCVLFEGLPIWLLALNKSMCDSVEISQFTTINELLGSLDGDYKVLFHRCLRNIGGSKLRFSIDTNSKFDITLISGSLTYLRNCSLQLKSPTI